MSSWLDHRPVLNFGRMEAVNRLSCTCGAELGEVRHADGVPAVQLLMARHRDAAIPRKA